MNLIQIMRLIGVFLNPATLMKLLDVAATVTAMLASEGVIDDAKKVELQKTAEEKIGTIMASKGYTVSITAIRFAIATALLLTKANKAGAVLPTRAKSSPE